MSSRSRPLLLLAAVLLFWSSPSHAFTYIVRSGDTIAGIAQNLYGEPRYERVLVAANRLDERGGIQIQPGMRLEVPAVSYVTAAVGDTFATLAGELLGSAVRAAVLAEVNDSKPWLPPAPGQRLLIPYNLRIVIDRDESTPGLAFRYLGNRKHAWTLDYYNGLEGRPLKRGDTILIPLSDLPLTEAGREAARRAEVARKSEASGKEREAQRGVSAELPGLALDVRSGRYVDAVVNGTRLLASAEPTKPQLASIHRLLLEAFVALGAQGRAGESCEEWQKHDPAATLDPTLLSPKLLEACAAARARKGPATP